MTGAPSHVPHLLTSVSLVPMTLEGTFLLTRNLEGVYVPVSSCMPLGPPQVEAGSGGDSPHLLSQVELPASLTPSEGLGPAQSWPQKHLHYMTDA